MMQIEENESKPVIPFDEGLAMLIKEQEGNQRPTQENPKVLPLSVIRMAHSVFQPRQFEEGTMSSSEEHIRTLTTAIGNEPSHTLDPITVWWSGTCWRVIDGHHRTLAYSRAVKIHPKQKNVLIPVNIFKGNLWEAIAEATRLNSKDKLPMNRSDKYNRAWKMTVIDQYPKHKLASICKIGTTTIARMRNIYTEIKAKRQNRHFEYAVGLTWEEAQHFGKEDRVIDDSWESKLANEWSKRFGKTFGYKLAEHPKIAAMALELYSEKLVAGLVEEWGNYDDEEVTLEPNDPVF